MGKEGIAFFLQPLIENAIGLAVACVLFLVFMWIRDA
jgi:hypothetical protein